MNEHDLLAGPALAPYLYESIDGVICEVMRPSGPTRNNVIALHGILSDSSSYRTFLAPFAARGYAVYAINYPHHGPEYCPQRVGELRATDCVDAARRVLRAVGGGVVIGKSFGGLVAQALSHEPEVRATVLLASSPPPGVRYTPNLMKSVPILYRLGTRTLYQLSTQRTFRFPFEFCRRYIYNAAANEEQARSWHGPCAESVWLVWDQVRYRVPVYPHLRHAPMLVTVGSDDPGLPVWVQSQVAEIWDAEYHEFAGHSHMLTWEPGWPMVCAKVLDWLDARALPLPANGAGAGGLWPDAVPAESDAATPI